MCMSMCIFLWLVVYVCLAGRGAYPSVEEGGFPRERCGVACLIYGHICSGLSVSLLCLCACLRVVCRQESTTHRGPGHCSLVASWVGCCINVLFLLLLLRTECASCATPQPEVQQASQRASWPTFFRPLPAPVQARSAAAKTAARPDVGVRMGGSVAGMHTRLNSTGAERQGCKVRKGLQTWKQYKSERSHTYEYVLEQLSNSN